MQKRNACRVQIDDTANATKHGEQEFTTGENTQAGATMVRAGLTAETTLFGIFKPTEKDSLETTLDVTYKQAVEQMA